MRIFAALILLGLASEGWAETGISGMLACTPKDSQQKPVIYAFDGQMTVWIYILHSFQLKKP